MRTLLALALTILTTLIALAPVTASAADTKRFEKPDLGIAFNYPSNWAASSNEPRGVLPNEAFNVRTGSPATGFAVAVYRLDPPVTMDTLDASLKQLDKQVQAYVSKLPGGKITAIYDTVVDDADGREYEYELQLDGRTIHADMIVVPNADKAVEVTQWAPADEYAAQQPAFDAIFDTLALPWTQRPA